jgi:transposase
VVEGAIIKVLFEAYVERILAPSLRIGQAVVMNNLSAHKGEKVRKVIEARGCKLLYLSPYSPAYNPIEETLSKSRGLLRKAAARTREALIEALWAAPHPLANRVPPTPVTARMSGAGSMSPAPLV